MRLVAEFDEFLENTVNLNKTRIETLEARVETIKTFLIDSEYAPEIVRFAAQGSWAHKTIIKPPSDKKEFDADLVVYVRPHAGWEPEDYILELRRTFRTNATYKDKTSMKSRCVTIDYAGDFHLDVVPIIDRGGTYEVCNRNTNEFERTDGDGFAEWWLGQDKIAGDERLIAVTRLLKYLRDIKGTFSAKSILLTTLIGRQVGFGDQFVDWGQFEDVPKALHTIFKRLDEWLDERPDLPDVTNPAMPEESFTRHWDQEKYENFRAKIHQYREWIDDAYSESDRDESIRKWRRVFGNGFAQGETLEKGQSAVAILAERFSRGADLVDAVIASGRRVLDRMPRVLPHMEASQYKASGRKVPIRVVAHERQEKHGSNLRRLDSGELIQKHSGLYFEAFQQNGLPFPGQDYWISWQIVNTDKEAAAAMQLRGEFTRPSKNHGHFEETLYRGVHWVQAFLISRRTKMIDGISDRFFVVIE